MATEELAVEFFGGPEDGSAIMVPVKDHATPDKVRFPDPSRSEKPIAKGDEVHVYVPVVRKGRRAYLYAGTEEA